MLRAFLLSPFGWFFFVMLFILLLIFAYMLYVRFDETKHSVSTDHKNHQRGKRKSVQGGGGICPVCNESLSMKESVITEVFQSSETDRLCYVHGCPRCRENRITTKARRCPVCGDSVPITEYLFARHFIHPGRKTHIHILGCKKCR